MSSQQAETVGQHAESSGSGSEFEEVGLEEAHRPAPGSHSKAAVGGSLAAAGAASSAPTTQPAAAPPADSPARAPAAASPSTTAADQPPSQADDSAKEPAAAAVLGSAGSAPEAAAEGALEHNTVSTAPDGTSIVLPSGGAAHDGDIMYEAIREVDEAVHKAVQSASAAAKDVSAKLMGGGVVSEARAGLTALASGVTSWWSSLDPPAKPQQPAPHPRAAPDGPPAAAGSLAERFGLAPDEELVEEFSCALAQTYICPHNDYTPPRQVTFRGTLYITGQHFCFWAEDQADGTPVKLRVPHADITSAETVEIMGSKEPALRIDTAEERWLVFQGFPPASADSALALIEHLTAGE